MRRSITAKWIGRVGYDEAHALQKELLRKRLDKEVGDTILLLEHEPVVTLGRGADAENVLGGEAALRARGVDLAETGRGGDVTYHGPGQLVAYPIVDLRPERCDVRRYVNDLARVMVALCKDSGIGAGVIPGDSRYVGVWVDLDSPSRWTEISSDDARFPHRRLAKIGAIGVRLSHWVTMHGFAFNVTTDLSGFSLIVPCGIREYGVTSLADLGAPAPSLEQVARSAARHFADVLDADVSFRELESGALERDPSA